MKYFLFCLSFLCIVFGSEGMRKKEDSGYASVRNSVKLVLLNDENKILLMGTDDKSIRSADGAYAGRFWQLIGGSAEEGESIEQVARRELFEETGFGRKDIEIGHVIWHGEFNLKMKGVLTHVNQNFVIARTHRKRPTTNYLTFEEVPVVKKLKWFSLDDIAASTEIIYPTCLLKYLTPVVAGTIPQEVIEIEL